MKLRRYTADDCQILAQLFFNTVHTINAKDYSQKQLDAWATGQIDLKQWNHSLLTHYAVVAEIGEVVVGFGDIAKTGYLDRLFVHADYQRQGVATALCDKLEQHCCTEKVVTHASITAKGFFLKRGYKIVTKQQVQRQGVLLTNYVMERRLSSLSSDEKREVDSLLK